MSRSRTSRLGALLAVCGAVALLVAGCKAEIQGLIGKEKPGLDPPVDSLYFPTGLAITPDGRYLFVTNGNTDLRYNGGHVQVVDMREALGRVQAPLNFPGSCRPALQEPGVIDCEETEFVADDGTRIGGLILQGLTVRIGFYPNFVGMEDLQQSRTFFDTWPVDAHPDGVRRFRLYTPVRGDPSLTFIDVIMTSDATGAELVCLDCGQGCGPVDGIRDCEDGYVIIDPSEPRQAEIPDPLGGEPYAVGIDPELGYLVLAHAVQGRISLVDLAAHDGDPRPGGPDLVDTISQAMSSDAEGRSGGYDVAILSPGDPEGWIYISNRDAAQIVTLRVSGAELAVGGDRGLQLIQGPSIVLTAPFGPLESGSDVRGLALSADRSRLYALSNAPPSLVVIDVTEENGRPQNQVLDVIEVCPRPSVLRTRIGPVGRELAYAVCFGSGEVWVVDPEGAQVVDKIFVGAGPHDLLIAPTGAGVATDLQGFAYVANFGENTVGIIDLRPDSITYHQMIGRIGWPEELQRD